MLVPLTTADSQERAGNESAGSREPRERRERSHRRQPQYEDELIRLRVKAQLAGVEGFSLILEGKSADCFHRLEYAVCSWFGSHVEGGFRLGLDSGLVRPDATPVLVTPRRLHEASLWTRWVNIFVLLCPPGPRVFQHGRWIQSAATTIQRSWRAQSAWCRHVDIVDVLEVFAMAVSRRGLHSWKVERLLESFGTNPAETRYDVNTVKLAIALSTCEDSISQFTSIPVS